MKRIAVVALCVGALGLLGLSLWRGALDAMARWLGIHYGPALLLLLLAVFVFVALLFFSVVVSRQRVQIERLIEDQAILEARIRFLNQGGPPVTPGKPVARLGTEEGDGKEDAGGSDGGGPE